MKRPNPKTIIIIVGTGFLFLVLATFAPTFAQQDQKQEGKDRQDQQQGKDRQDQQQQQQEQGKHEQQQQAKDQQEQHQQQAKSQEEHQQPQQEKGQQEQQQQQAKDQQEQQPQAKAPQQVQQQQQAKSKKKASVQQQQQQTHGLKKQAADQQPQQQAKSPQTQQQPKPQQAQQAKGLKKQQQQASTPPQKMQIIQKSEQPAVWQQHRAQSWQTEHRTWQQRGGYNGFRIPDDRFRGYFGRSHGFRIYSHSLELFGGYPRFRYEGYWFSVVDPWPEYWSADWYQNDDVYIDYFGDGYYLYNRRYPNDRIAVMVYMN
jgi:chemotaxis protein histidine kinase CheA